MRDTEAAAGLAEEISDVSSNALAIEIDAWHPRDDVRNDRARRLLIGVRDGGIVPPIDPGLREQFAREAELGSMPLREAVEQVTGTLVEEVIALGAAFRTRGKADLRRLNKIQRQVESEHGALARDVTVAYLLASARRRDTEETYFDRQLKERHGTLG